MTADWHGTAAAGVAMAASNAACGVGAAYEASGAGIRMISGPVSDATEATGMTYQYVGGGVLWFFFFPSVLFLIIFILLICKY